MFSTKKIISVFAAVCLLLTTLAGVIVVLMMLIPEISSLFSTVKALFDL